MAYQHESHSAKRVRRLLARTGHHHGLHGGHLKIGGSIAAHADEMQDKKMIDESVRRAMHEHDDQQHHGHHTRLRLQDGGSAEGPMSEPRADQAPRGRKGKGGGKDAKNHIAIVIAPQGGGQQPPPRPVPVPVPARPPVAGAGPPPPGAGGPPGMPPGGPPPGAPPMRPPVAAGPGATPMPPPMGTGMQPGGGPPLMRARGGRTRRTVAESTAGVSTPPNAQEYAEDMPRRMQRPEQEIETAEGQRTGGRSHRAHGGDVGPGRKEMTAGAGSGQGRVERSQDLPYCAGGRA